MGSIPLPALEGRQPAPPSTLNAVAQMEAIKASQQEQQVRDLAIQQQQMQLNDQKAMTAAMQEWDGNDWNQMPLLIRKHGGSANAIIGMQNQILQRQRDLATLSKDQLANEAAKHDQVVGALSPLTDPKQVSDADLPNAIRSTAQDLMKRGLLDPQHEQTAEQLANLDPATARAQLGMFSKGLMGEKAQVENAAKQAEVQKNTAQASEAQANTEKTQLETDLLKKYGFSSPAQMEAKYVSLDMQKRRGQKVSPDDQAFMDSYKQAKLMVPAATAQIRMEGFGKIRQFPVFDNQTHQTVYMDSNEINDAKLREPGRYTVPQYTPEAIGQKKTTEYFTGGKGGQQLTAFNTAMQHLDLLDKLGADLNNSDVQILNRAKQAWAEQTGSAAPANFEAAKNAMSGEVAAALKASGATDQEIAKVDQTFSRKQSPEQIKGAIDTYRQLLQSKAHNLGMQYQAGMSGKPNLPTGEGDSTKGGAMKITLPSGKQITIE